MSKPLLVLIMLFIQSVMVIKQVYSQDSVGLTQANADDFIRVISRAHKDSIVLRWAPSAPAAWQLLNKYGYRIERYTIGRDGQMLEQKPMVVLVNGLKPAPQTQWELWMEKNDMVAVAAQAIFGEEFLIDADQGDIMQIYNKVRELESRYSFGLFAADLSMKAAQLSGLRWVDRDVKQNEMYLYRVYSLVPESLAPIKFGFTYTGPSEARSLPVPRAPEVENVTETSVLIRWETYGLRDVYTSYFLERSVDNGRTFTKVNNVPMTILESTANGDGTAYSAQSDTVIMGVKVVYRIRGMNSFGEEGPPSEILDFMGERKFEANPSIIKTDIINNAHVKLTWEFPPEALTELGGFEIERSIRPNDGYRVITPDLLNPDQNEYVDQSPSSTNYYRVAAVSVKGYRTVSFPNLVQLEDSIPPLPPTGLAVVVDSTGIVKLTWNNNTEQDLLGYRVYRSSFMNSEFGQVTVSPVSDPIFVDTVNIKTLTNKMYYKLVAVDNRFNPSGFSETIKLVLPDIVPPVPPAVKSIRSLEGGVELQWINSSSEDVVEHHVLRKHQFSRAWDLVAKISVKDTGRYYFDKSDSRHRYQYAMVAVDSTGLKSVMTKPLWGVALLTNKSKIEDVQGLADREKKIIHLIWSYQETNIEKFLVYRSTKDTGMALYKSVVAPAADFVDNNLSTNTEYTYRVKAVFRDGTESFFSDEVKINY